MKLSKIISLINVNEISKFYNILSSINEEVKFGKNADADRFVKSFNQPEVRKKYKKYIQNQRKMSFELDIIIDIIIRDGNMIMSRDWFKSLVEREIGNLKVKIDSFDYLVNCEEEDDITETNSSRNSRIYYNCVSTAFSNDSNRGGQNTITADELTILDTLKESLNISTEDARAIYFLVIKSDFLNNIEIDNWITKIKDSGIGFYHSKNMMIYIPEEFIFLLRELKGKKIADKNARRILKCLDDKSINKIKKNHGLKTVDRCDKIEDIITQGIDIKSILADEIYDEDLKSIDKKKILQEIIESKLEIHLEKTGRTISERLDILFAYFNDNEKDQNIGMSKDGYDRLISDLQQYDKMFENLIREKFEIDPLVILNPDNLIDYNIKPRDILYLISLDQLKKICTERGFSYRSKNVVNVIISSYSESDTLFIENYSLIGNNDINALKNNGIEIKAEEMGVVFENVTKSLLNKLTFNVDENLRKEINNKKEKADIIINLENKEIIIGECKSSKKNYSSFSSIIRQLKSYVSYYTKQGFSVKGVIVFSGSFSDDFVTSSDLFSDFTLALIEAHSLYNIYEEFKKMHKKHFPVNLFMRQGLISDEKTIKALRQ